jgi:RimJ/RimL family protein N-acetyltransferase
MLTIIHGCDFSSWLADRMYVRPEFRRPHVSIGIGDDERLLCAVLYEDFNGSNIFAHIAAEPNSYWATRRTLDAIFRYPFITCGCERITVTVAKNNLPSRELAKRMGFTLEGNVRHGYKYGDKFQDLLCYGMLKDECRWLR